MFEPGTNQRPVYFHFDLRFTISILFGHAHSRWFCRSTSGEDSESRRFELNIWLSFSQADHGQEIFLSCFFQV